ncbi:MAG: alginate lyase family protein [Cyanobacteria bacterium J06629_19]
MVKKVIGFFIVGIILFVGGSFAISALRTPLPPQLSQDPTVYLETSEVSQIRTAVDSASHPNTYLNAAEIADIKAKVEDGAEPWKSAYDRMIEEANTALSAQPYSITHNGGPNDGHDYQTQRAYCGWLAVDNREPDCRDGKINPNADRQDYEQAIALGKDASTLGLAYAFTDNPVYAEKLLSVIRVWCINESTRMNPKFTSQQSKIELSISIPGLFYGADLAYRYPNWPAEEKAQFEDWTHQMAESALTWNRTNNFENWRVHFIASAGSLLKDETLLDYAFGRFKELVPVQIDERGRMIRELDRTNSLSYSLYAVNAMIQTAEIAKHQDIDLYSYTSDGNAGLEQALDYHAQFAASKEARGWPHEQISSLKALDNVALYEMAYAHWQKPEYLNVIEYWERPMTERRIHWHISLTHGHS